MRRSRHILAVLIVAAALCADRSLAAPSARPMVSSQAASQTFAGRLIERQSTGLKGAVDVRLTETPVRPEGLRLAMIRRPADQTLHRQHPPITPFQFRLPPPALV